MPWATEPPFGRRASEEGKRSHLIRERREQKQRGFKVRVSVPEQICRIEMV